MKHTLLVLACCAFAVCQTVAQDCAPRYQSEVFSSITKTVVEYSDVYKDPNDTAAFMKMNIYTPDGDNFAKRPVVIMAHGGTFVAGDKDEGTSDTLCQTFAKRGFVTASINYRLAGSQTELFDSINALRIALRAVSDMKAAVRYFTKDAATDNEYRIDENQIWVGGNSAGGIIALHVAYVTDTNELPGYLKTVVAQNGGIDGNSGNAGYSSAVAGVINLAGGINKLAWIEAGDLPLVSCHGNGDQTVPYNCDDVLQSLGGNFFDLVDLCGSGAMKTYCDQVGTEDSLLTFPGDGHVPWENNAGKRTQMMNYVTSFVGNHIICDTTTVILGIKEVAAKNFFSVYPNPATNHVQIKMKNTGSDAVAEVQLFNSIGKLVKQERFTTGREMQLSLNGLEKGVYLVRVTAGGQSSTAAINKL